MRIEVFPFFVMTPFDWRDHSRTMFLRGAADGLTIRSVTGAGVAAGAFGARVVMMVSFDMRRARSSSIVRGVEVH
jgi:hypothetical protein